MQIYQEGNALGHLFELPGWVFRNNGIEKEFLFQDFTEAWAFMSRVALLAERMDHHPDWSNVYRTVRIRLSTHEAGGVTDKDFALAKAIEGK